jgi:hypothetical protein
MLLLSQVMCVRSCCIYKRPVCHALQHQRVDNATFVKTNVIADVIDKYNNDINMVESEYPCKYIAMFQTCLIIGLMIYMFWDNDKPDKSHSDPI